MRRIALLGHILALSHCAPDEIVDRRADLIDTDEITAFECRRVFKYCGVFLIDCANDAPICELYREDTMFRFYCENGRVMCSTTRTEEWVVQ